MHILREQIVRLTVVGVMCAFAGPALGQLLIDPIGKADPGKVDGALGVGFFKADYDGEFKGAASDGTIERNYLLSSVALGVNEYFDVAMGAAYSYKTEIGKFDDDDTGFIVGGGVRSRLWQKDASAIHAYGQATYVDEEYGTERVVGDLVDFKESTTSVEILIGALYAYSIDAFTLYGGAELVPYSDGELDVKVSSRDRPDLLDESVTVDLEREDIISIKLGGQIQAGAFRVQADATLIGEETFRVAVVMPF